MDVFLVLWLPPFPFQFQERNERCSRTMNPCRGIQLGVPRLWVGTLSLDNFFAVGGPPPRALPAEVCTRLVVALV